MQAAKQYYIESFSWSRIEYLDNKLFKRALKSLIQLNREYGVAIPEAKILIHLSKFYVKDRSIQVIMEMCHEQPQVHKVLINFIITHIFDKLKPNDYFSFMTLRSGTRAYQNIPLEMNKFNTNIKRRYLSDQTVTQKPVDVESSDELAKAFM